jgi:lipoprotein-releasing system ATP-binding protein
VDREVRVWQMTGGTETSKADEPAAGQPRGREPVVRASGLGKIYRSGASALEVLTEVDFSVVAGEMVAIVGPSGAGKSTFLHLLAALDTPTSGTVYFNARALDSLSERARAEFRRRSIGFIWQRHHLLADFTAAENVAMPLFLQGVERAEALLHARQWLEEVGLAGRAEHRPSELSGGEQQRVAIARALVNWPQVLLADEPTGDLDEQNAEAVFALMKKLHRSHQLTSILATHNLALARRCDRVLALQHGQLLPGEGVLPGQSQPERAVSGLRNDSERKRG